MLRENIHDLMSFFVVAREKNFTRAASQLGVSQSALSHSMRKLEERLGIQLLRRTTRSVSATEIGERLITLFAPHLDIMESDLDALCQTRSRPSGTIRITAAEYSARFILWPKLLPLLKKYPDIHLEISIDNSLTDIVADKFYAWEFEENGREIAVRVDSQLSFNTPDQLLDAAEAGFGIAFTTESEAHDRIKSGRLIHVLKEFCPPFPGYYLYYPSRRQHTPAFELIIDALRYKEP